MPTLTPLDVRQARRLRGVFRKILPGHGGRHPPPAVWFVPDGGGTLALVVTPDVVVTAAVPGLALDRPAVVPWARFARDATPVELEGAAAAPPAVPPLPEAWADNPPGFLAALDEAARATAKEDSRYALTRVQLRGRRGEVVATDATAALVWGGWSFPFADDVLVARCGAFGTPELAAGKGVRVGRTPAHVVVRAGAWTVFLAAHAGGRFPDVVGVVPPPGAARTRLVLDPGEAAALAGGLAKLPGTADSSPVTLDLGGRVVVRARGGDDRQATAVALPASRAEGPAVRVACDRRHLARACRLGCLAVEIAAPDKPVVARGRNTILVWVPVAGGVLDPTPGDARIGLTALGGRAARPSNRRGRTPDPVVPVSMPVRRTTPVPVPPAAPAAPRPGLFDTLLAGSTWLLAAVRLRRPPDRAA